MYHTWIIICADIHVKYDICINVYLIAVIFCSVSLRPRFGAKSNSRLVDNSEKSSSPKPNGTPMKKVYYTVALFLSVLIQKICMHITVPT